MKVGDLILVQVDADSWRRGTFLGQRSVTEGRAQNQHELMYKVGIGEPYYFNYEEREVYPHSVKRFIPLSEEDAKAKHDSELMPAYTMAQAALFALMPGEKIEVKDGSIVGYGGAVTLDPVVYETPRIGAVQETAGWQVTVWKYHYATRHQPEEYEDCPVGDATNYRTAVQKFIETLFKLKAEGYWDHLADEAMAQAWADGEM